MKLNKKGKFEFNSFINSILGIFIFSSIIGTIAIAVENSTLNLTGGVSTVMKLTTLILIIGFIILVIKTNINKHKR